MLYVALSVTGAAVVVAALIWFANHQVGVVLHKIGTLQPPNIPEQGHPNAIDKALLTRLEELERQIPDLFKAVAEGIEHVDRNEKRVRGIVTGAKRRFAAEGYEDPGVEAEFDSLPDVDAGSGESQGVLPLSNDVGAVEEQGSAWETVPGMRPTDQGVA